MENCEAMIINSLICIFIATGQELFLENLEISKFHFGFFFQGFQFYSFHVPDYLRVYLWALYFPSIISESVLSKQKRVNMFTL